MHHTLTEFIKMFVEDKNEWDDIACLAQIAYNSTKRDATEFSPFELVFGLRSRLPSSFSPKDALQDYDEYIAIRITLIRTRKYPRNLRSCPIN